MCNTTEQDSAKTNLSCPFASPSEDQVLVLLSFLLEGLFQMMISSLGLLTNTVSILVLQRRALRKNVFNQLLVVLAVFDLVYCTTTLLESLIRLGMPSYVYNIFFPHLIYPVNSIVMTGSIYMTMAIALERYLAVHQPMFRVPNQFSAITNDSSLRRKQLRQYVVPITLFSVIFNIPKYFESYLVFEENEVNIEVADFRMSYWYVTWYQNWARLVLLGVFPFLATSCFNFHIYLLLSKKRSIPPDTRRKKEENFFGVLLMIIVTFLVCNALRIFLNMHEIFVIDQIQLCKCSELGGFPVWVLILGFISPVFLVFNSSVNLIIYCIFSEKFRKELRIVMSYYTKAEESPSTEMNEFL